MCKTTRNHYPFEAIRALVVASTLADESIVRQILADFNVRRKAFEADALTDEWGAFSEFLRESLWKLQHPDAAAAPPSVVIQPTEPAQENSVFYMPLGSGTMIAMATTLARASIQAKAAAEREDNKHRELWSKRARETVDALESMVVEYGFTSANSEVTHQIKDTTINANVPNLISIDIKLKRAREAPAPLLLRFALTMGVRGHEVQYRKLASSGRVLEDPTPESALLTARQVFEIFSQHLDELRRLGGVGKES